MSGMGSDGERDDVRSVPNPLKRGFSFDTNAWLEQARSGRVMLVERRAEAQKGIEQLQREVKLLDEEIARIDRVIGPEKPPRQAGVLDLVRSVLLDHERKWPSPDGWPESEIIAAVRATCNGKDTRATSVASALRRLVKNGKIERLGERGNHSYRLATTLKSNSAQSRSDVMKEIEQILRNRPDARWTAEEISWLMKEPDLSLATTALGELVKLGAIGHDEAEVSRRYHVLPVKQQGLFGRE